jgi:hypothetical protein
MQIREPEWKKFGSGIRDGKKFGSGMEKFGSRIRDKHPGSAKLIGCIFKNVCV